MRLSEPNDNGNVGYTTYARQYIHAHVKSFGVNRKVAAGTFHMGSRQAMRTVGRSILLRLRIRSTRLPVRLQGLVLSC